VVVEEPFPQSTDEKIKVTMVEPDSKRVGGPGAAGRPSAVSNLSIPGAGCVVSASVWMRVSVIAC